MTEKTADIVPMGNLPFMDAIERLASNPDVDPDKLQKIMDMQEHILDRNAEQAFNSAMTMAQNRIELVVTKSENTQTKSNYANLSSVLVSAKPIYTREGFSLMFYEGETTVENHKRVEVDIMHEQGHTKKRHVDLAVQTTGIAGKAMMTEIHGEGSVFSYGRRYLTCMIFNIPTGDDTDGNVTLPEYITEKQKSTIVDMMNSVEADEAKFLDYLGVEAFDKLPAKAYNKAMAALTAKKKKERQPGEDDDRG